MLPTSKKQTVATVSHEIRLGVEDLENVPATQSPSHTELKETTSAMGHFSKSSSTTKMIFEIEFERKRVKFIERMSHILENLKSLKMEQDELENVFTMVLQSAEDYLYCDDHLKCQATKDDVCVSLLKGFCKDDEALCRQMVSFLRYKVKPSTLVRRHKRQFIRGLKFFLEFVFKAL